ncbi:MAG: family transcriptional regulator [Microbacterium sp.]|jgi:transcriptional regulator with XRE-family HTH domain|nr:family transcriptional regulator [Microbacterium sp.]
MIEFHKVRWDEREPLGRAFKQMREDAGWSVREVAACLQRDPSVVTRIEAGKLALTEEHMVKLRRELGVSVDELIDRSTPPSPFLDREEWTNRQGHWRALTPPGRRDQLFALTMERQASQPHTCVHAGEEFISVLSGSVIVTLGRTEHRIDVHSAVLTVAPYESHAVSLAPDCERAELLWTVPSDGVRRHRPIEGPTTAWTCLTNPERDEIEKRTGSRADASHTLEG